MSDAYTFYNSLIGNDGKESRIEWTDITATAQLITPDLPGTILTGTCDVATASPNVTDMKDAAAAALTPLSDKGVKQGFDITVDNSGTLVTKQVVSVDGDANTLVFSGNWGFTAGDATFWITPIGSFRYVILGFELFSATQAKYIFRDEAGSPATVYGPMWVGADGGAAMEIARRITAGDRIYIKQDGGTASLGSLHMWYMSERA